MKHYDLVILGSGSIAQSILRNCKLKNVLVVGRSAQKLEDKFDSETLSWTAGLDDFPLGITANKVVNAIMPTTFAAAKAAVDFALTLVRHPDAYFHLSTIAVFAKPRNNLVRCIFSGDNYIRVKKSELSYIKEIAPSSHIIFPGIVIGESTSWQNFFNSISDKKPFLVGFDVTKRAPVVHINSLGEGVCALLKSANASSEIFFPSFEDPDLPTWQQFLCQFNSDLIIKHYEFFDGFFKNLLAIFFVSKLSPSLLLERLSFRKVSPTPSYSEVQSKIVKFRTSASGMTNFYMGCNYVL